MKPKVTLGICARNAEKSIALALKSVIRQDFPHELMEIVFVDDGSEDNTLKIVEFCESKGVEIAGKINFDSLVTKTMVAGKLVVEYSLKNLVSNDIAELWNSKNVKLQEPGDYKITAIFTLITQALVETTRFEVM